MTVVHLDQWLSLAKMLVLTKAPGNSQGPRDPEHGPQPEQSFAVEVVNYRFHHHRVHSARVGEGSLRATRRIFAMLFRTRVQESSNMPTI